MPETFLIRFRGFKPSLMMGAAMAVAVPLTEVHSLAGEGEPAPIASPVAPVVLSPPSPSDGAPELVKVVRDPVTPEKPGIADLVLSTDAQSLELWQGIDAEHAHVELKGIYLRKEWSLLDDKSQVVLEGSADRPQDEFRMRIPYDARREWPITFKAIGPKGEIQDETIRLHTDVETFLLNQKVRLGWTPELGLIFLSHQETGMPTPFTQLGLNVGFHYQKNWSGSPWKIGGSLTGTVFALASSVAGTTIRNLNFSLRGGYAFLFIPYPWELDLTLGIRYSTQWVTQSAFGYQNLIFPQVYPTLSRRLGSGWKGSIFVRYSPLSEGVGFNLTERELSIGGSVEWLKVPLEFKVEYSSLAVLIRTGHWIYSDGVLFGVGHPF